MEHPKDTEIPKDNKSLLDTKFECVSDGIFAIPCREDRAASQSDDALSVNTHTRLKSSNDEGTNICQKTRLDSEDDIKSKRYQEDTISSFCCTNIENSIENPGVKERDMTTPSGSLLDVGCNIDGISLSNEVRIPRDQIDAIEFKNRIPDVDKKPDSSAGFFNKNSKVQLPYEEFSRQTSNNNHYVISNEDSCGSELDGEMNDVNPLEPTMSRVENDDTTHSSSSLSTSASLDTAENSPGSQNALPGINDKTLNDEKHIKTTVKKTYEQLSPAEIKILRSSLGEIVKTPDGNPLDIEDDNDDFDSPFSGGVPNHRPQQQSMYSANTGSSDSIIDAEKEAELSAAEFDFASVLPMCKGTTVSLKDRTQDDAQSLLNQIINGEPDPCLGPDAFGISRKPGRGYERGGGVVVREVTQEQGTDGQGNVHEQHDGEDNEEMNVSLHNAAKTDTGNGSDCVKESIILSENVRGKNVTRMDREQGGSYTVPCEGLVLEKFADGDSEEKDHVIKVDVANNGVGGSSRGGSVRKHMIKSGNDGVDFGGNVAVESGVKNANGGNQCSVKRCAGSGESDIEVPEKDENHKGSYVESVSGDSVIDSVIMENCDDGGDINNDAHGGDYEGDGITNGSNGEDEENNDAGGIDGKVNDDICEGDSENNTNYYNSTCPDADRPGGKYDTKQNGVQDQSIRKEEDSHPSDSSAKDERSGNDKASVWHWFQGCSFDDITDGQWKDYEKYNPIYENDATTNNFKNGTSRNQERVLIIGGGQNTSNCSLSGAPKRETIDKEGLETRESKMIERQLECNDNALPLVIPVELLQNQQDRSEREKTLDAASVSLDDSSMNAAGTVCPCNSEVYTCDASPNSRQNDGSHVTRLNGIREILKATELFFNQNDVDDVDDIQQDIPSLSNDPIGRAKKQSVSYSKHCNSYRSAASNTRSKNVNSKQRQAQLKAMNGTESKWTLEKQKPILPDIKKNNKPLRNPSRDGCSSSFTGNASNGACNASTLRIRKVGLTVKRLNTTQDNNKIQRRRSKERTPGSEVTPLQSRHLKTTLDRDDTPPGPSFHPNTDGPHGDNNPEIDSAESVKRVDGNKTTESLANYFSPSKHVSKKQNIAPVSSCSRSPRNVNANKTNRFSRYNEILNNLDTKGTGVASCSATSSACTMTSFIRETDGSLFSNHGEDYSRKRGDGGMRSSSVGNDCDWETPVGGRNLVPPLRRPKLESSVLYKPKRHLNPKNASAEEYHRYKMDLRLSQSLAKIKRGPPTVDCYLDPRLHQKASNDSNRSRSRSQKRLPEVTQ